jgi:hypothetical protein
MTVCLQQFLPFGDLNLNCNNGTINGDRITTELNCHVLSCVEKELVLCRAAYSNRKNTGVRVRNTEMNPA